VPRKPVKTRAARSRAASPRRRARPTAPPPPPAIPPEHDRFAYSAIVDRPRLEWPNGARVAVWVIPNIEHFLFDRPSTRIANLPVNPDVLNYA
jgi:allantoinase